LFEVKNMRKAIAVIPKTRNVRAHRPSSAPVFAVCVLVVLPKLASAEPPSGGAVSAWDAYVRKAEAQIEAASTHHGSSADLAPAAHVALERGEVVVETGAAEAHVVEVPDGLIHHWRGRVLVPNVSLERVVAVVRDPAAHKQEDVLEGRLLDRAGDTDRVFLKVRRASLVTAAYNTEHVVTYRAFGDDCVRSRSVATKIAEIEGLGTPAEREKPPGSDRGFLWRMNAYWHYEAVTGGVMITLDSMTLSRSVPWALSPIASPIVNRVARESVVRTLRSLRARFEE
jgi:hypothetical protein